MSNEGSSSRDALRPSDMHSLKAINVRIVSILQCHSREFVDRHLTDLLAVGFCPTAPAKLAARCQWPIPVMLSSPTGPIGALLTLPMVK